jgi:hypothetical protein
MTVKVSKMDEPKFDINHWAGKSPEEVLQRSFHELRNPISLLGGYLSVLKSADWSDEKTQHFLDLALNYALYSRDIVNSVYHYMNEKEKD